MFLGDAPKWWFSCGFPFETTKQNGYTHKLRTSQNRFIHRRLPTTNNWTFSLSPLLPMLDSLKPPSAGVLLDMSAQRGQIKFKTCMKRGMAPNFPNFPNSACGPACLAPTPGTKTQNSTLKAPLLPCLWDLFQLLHARHRVLSATLKGRNTHELTNTPKESWWPNQQL